MKTPSRSLSQRLVLYGIGAGAVTGVAAAAHHGHGHHHKPKETIKYSGPVEFSGHDIFFDLQNFTPPSDSANPSDDFKLNTKCGGFSGDFTKTAKVNGKSNSTEKSKIAVQDGNCGELDAIQFHAGDTIGTQRNWSMTAFMDAYFYNGNTEIGCYGGQWHPGDRGFLGLRISIGCNTYYGWADVTLHTIKCLGDFPVFTLHSYAYNTEPDESIKAGEKKTLDTHIHLNKVACTPTPTPSATIRPESALGLLIAGAAGIGALKQRRRDD